MEHYDTLAQDIFREIGNIGSGHASVAMSLLVDGKTHISRTETLLSSPKSLLKNEFVGKGNVDILHLGIGGDLAGDTFILMFDDTSSQLSRLLMEKKGKASFGDSISAIQEFGNIIVGSYMNALSNLVHLSAIPRVSNFIPQGRQDDVLGALGLRAGEKAVAIKTHVMNTDYAISVAIFVLFDQGSLGKILTRTRPKDILVIDSPEKAGKIKNLLEEYSNISVLHAKDIGSARIIAKERPPYLCLVDGSLLGSIKPQALKAAAGKNGRIAVMGKADSHSFGGQLSFLKGQVTKEKLIRLIDAP